MEKPKLEDFGLKEKPEIVKKLEALQPDKKDKLFEIIINILINLKASKGPKVSAFFINAGVIGGSVKTLINEFGLNMYEIKILIQSLEYHLMDHGKKMGIKFAKEKWDVSGFNKTKKDTNRLIRRNKAKRQERRTGATTTIGNFIKFNSKNKNRKGATNEN